MHLRIETKDKLALSAVLSALLDTFLPPDWTVQASFGRIDDEYWLTADYASAEKLESRQRENGI
jgi:hypothetical protein